MGATLFPSDGTKKFCERNESFFLTKIGGIHNPDILKQIIEETQGDPLLLNLYENMYQDFVQSNPLTAVAQFLEIFDETFHQDVYTRLSIRYLRYLESGIDREQTKKQAELLRILACIGSWNEEEAANRGVLEDVQTINQKSLVQSTVDEEGQEVFYMDRTVQQTLLEGQIDGKKLISDDVKEQGLSYLVEKSSHTLLRTKEMEQVIRLTMLLHPDKSDEETYQLILTHLELYFNQLIAQRNFRLLMNRRFEVLDQFSGAFFASEYGETIFLETVLALMNLKLFDYSGKIALLLPKLTVTDKVAACLGQYSFFAGQFDQSISYYKQAIDQFPAAEVPLTSQETAAVLGYAQTLILSSSFDALKDFVDQMQNRMPHNKGTFVEISLLQIAIGVSSKIGHHEKTIQLYHQLEEAAATATLTPKERLSVKQFFVSLYAFSGQEAKAILTGNEYLEEINQTEGIQEEEVALDKVYNSLSYAWLRMGNFSEAVRYQTLMVNLREEKLGEHHYRTIQSYNNLAYSYLSEYGNARMNYSNRPELLVESEELLIKANDLATEYLGEGHYLTSMILTNYGLLKSYKGELEKSFDLYKQSYFQKSRIYGEDSTHTFVAKYRMYKAEFYWLYQTNKNHPELARVKENFIDLLQDPLVNDTLGEDQIVELIDYIHMI